MPVSKVRLLQKCLHCAEFAFKLLTLGSLFFAALFGLRVIAPISSQAEVTERTTSFETYTSTVTVFSNTTTPQASCPVANGTTVNCNIARSLTDTNGQQEYITGSHAYVISPPLSAAGQASQALCEEFALFFFVCSLVLDLYFLSSTGARKGRLRRILIGV